VSDVGEVFVVSSDLIAEKREWAEDALDDAHAGGAGEGYERVVALATAMILESLHVLHDHLPIERVREQVEAMARHVESEISDSDESGGSGRTH